MFDFSQVSHLTNICVSQCTCSGQNCLRKVDCIYKTIFCVQNLTFFRCLDVSLFKFPKHIWHIAVHFQETHTSVKWWRQKSSKSWHLGGTKRFMKCRFISPFILEKPFGPGAGAGTIRVRRQSDKILWLIQVAIFFIPRAG